MAPGPPNEEDTVITLSPACGFGGLITLRAELLALYWFSVN